MPEMIPYLLILWTSFLMNNSMTDNRMNVFCVDLSEDILLEILGPAYNSRYMSVTRPFDNDIDDPDQTGMKRNIDLLSFHVEENYERILDDKPAWVSHNHYYIEQPVEVDRTRRDFTNVSNNKKRSISGSQKQWECEAKVIWLDLGQEYFPRYLRSVECVQKLCWYGHFHCKPRSFTVKLLRKRQGMCVPVHPGTTVGNAGLPSDLSTLWVWEERAVTFCCDCSQ